MRGHPSPHEFVTCRHQERCDSVQAVKRTPNESQMSSTPPGTACRRVCLGWLSTATERSYGEESVRTREDTLQNAVF